MCGPHLASSILNKVGCRLQSSLSLIQLRKSACLLVSSLGIHSGSILICDKIEIRKIASAFHWRAGLWLLVVRILTTFWLPVTSTLCGSATCLLKILTPCGQPEVPARLNSDWLPVRATAFGQCDNHAQSYICHSQYYWHLSIQT